MSPLFLCNRSTQDVTAHGVLFPCQQTDGIDPHVDKDDLFKRGP